MSKKHAPELAEDQLDEGVQHVKAAITPTTPRRVGAAPHTVHGLDCECTDEEIKHTLRYVAAMVHESPTADARAKGAIDWATLVPLILQIISMFKRTPIPGT